MPVWTSFRVMATLCLFRHRLDLARTHIRVRFTVTVTGTVTVTVALNVRARRLGRCCVFAVVAIARACRDGLNSRLSGNAAAAAAAW